MMVQDLKNEWNDKTVTQKLYALYLILTQKSHFDDIYWHEIIIKTVSKLDTGQKNSQ